ncbi:hypothetical protein FB451DRAFT_1552277 [Mycena latifolia]|nr:hypothetical protein FB451DRAFT_1552277 [Mycena latifolia]
MADSPPPPKPKPGSLRDRIATFEKPNAAGKPAPAPPPLRPKPSGAVSWKPKPPSPPAESSSFSAGEGEATTSDAKESIGRGGSLKERMAALQGRGAFGAPAPAPSPPMGTGKKWVPPPKLVEVEEEAVVAPVVDRGKVEREETAEDAPKAEGEEEEGEEKGGRRRSAVRLLPRAWRASAASPPMKKCSSEPTQRQDEPDATGRKRKAQSTQQIREPSLGTDPTVRKAHYLALLAGVRSLNEQRVRLLPRLLMSARPIALECSSTISIQLCCTPREKVCGAIANRGAR